MAGRFHSGRRAFAGRGLIGFTAAAAIVALAGLSLMANAGSGAGPSAQLPGQSPSPASESVAMPVAPYPTGADQVAGSTYPVPGTLSFDPGPGLLGAPTFPSIDLLVTPSPAPARGAQPTDPSFTVDPRRQLPQQSLDWLRLKAAGRIALSGGNVADLPEGSNPLLDATGQPLPVERQLDTSWTRWIVEPFGYGADEKGTRYSDLSYWNLCGDGATAVALWYWQQQTGHPDVAGTAGYFLDPYLEQGVDWPASGPTIAVSGGTRLGTYWSGSDQVSGFMAHGRGYVMYLAMAAHPPTWQSSGLAAFARNGKSLYPTAGTSPSAILTGLNWEASGHDPAGWAQTYYAYVIRQDPTLARDLTAAVMLDVGRDGVPVVGAVDTYNLPNWQAGSATPHTRHAIAIVGYDNAASPPTYTYIDTCGRSCNSRGGNQNGQLHVISQADMVLAIQNEVGAGFVW